jgi:cell division protein FtsW (lipid II flippase)
MRVVRSLRIAARPRPRLTELVLLVVASAITLAAYAPLALGPAGQLRPANLLRPAVLIGIILVVHLGLVVGGHGEDPTLLPLGLALLGVGLALSVRLAPALADRQFQWILVGATGMLIATRLPDDALRWLRRYRYSWAALGVVLVALTFLFGRSASADGPRLWLGSATIGFQPSEILKLLLVVFLAGYLADKRELLARASSHLGPLRLPPLPYLAPMAVMLGVSLGLLVVQRDLGAALLLFAIALGMLYLASGRSAYVLAALAVFVIGAYAVHDRVDVVRTRVAIWRDPWSRAQTSGYQPLQAAMAIGSGGIIGAGLGQGSPTVIPAVHTDFVYAAVAEELGVAGAAALLALYALLLLRGFRIAARAPDAFAALLAAGLALSLAVQALIIVGGIVRLIPLTGITLPFLAHGGTSLVVCTLSLGLLVRLSREST